ncbi:MAG: hypothetical protein QXP45_01455 [Thermoproteota archaeon]
MKRIILVVLFTIMLSMQAFYPRNKIASHASPEALEETGPVLQSRIVMQSSLAAFSKKKVILSGYQYASDKIEYPTPEDSVVFGSFGPVAWSGLYWTTRDYLSPIRDGYAIFWNEVFQIRYTPFVDENYFRINSTYPMVIQNFTVPSSYDNFEVKHVWLVVRVYSGSVKLHAEIWNYGMISFGTSTETVTVTGPYDWWIAMKMMTPRVLKAGETYRLIVSWEGGSGVDVKIMSDSKDADDNAQGNARFFNTITGNMENIIGKMLAGVLTHPASSTYSTSFTAWSKALLLGNYQLYLHGRNIPRGSILMKVNSLVFGAGETPEVRLALPFDELVFSISIQGSTSFSGGIVEISSDLVSMEQSRVSYDDDNPPPFFRPFASLSVFTDNAGKPWGEWEIGGGTWEAYVEDYYGNLHALPADRVEQREHGLKITYPLFFHPPASPSYGFLNFTVKFNYTLEVSSRGPEFYSKYSVSPLSNASWNIFNTNFYFAAPPYSSVTIKIGPVPRDWIIQRAFITPGLGGGTPSVLVMNDEITISGILMGASNTYSGRAEIRVKADNYLETQAAYIRVKWMSVFSSILLENDTVRIEARAASAIPSFPPGVISIRVVGPAGVLFNQSLNQLDQNGVVTGELYLSKAGQYLVGATYKSSDGLRVGMTEAYLNVLRVSVSTDRRIVPLSSPTVTIELASSNISLISSAKFVLTSPNGSTKMVMFEKEGGIFVRNLSFPQTDPYAVGNWSITASILLLNGIERQLLSIGFLVLDDIPPVISNITQQPKEATFMEDVSITCTVTDKGTGVRSVWISYKSGAAGGNVTAKPVGLNTYSVIIPRQHPFATVSYRVYAADNSGNISFSEELAYSVAIPLWISTMLILFLIVIIVLIIWLYSKRRKMPPPPPPEAPPGPIAPPPTTQQPGDNPAAKNDIL